MNIILAVISLTFSLLGLGAATVCLRLSKYRWEQILWVIVIILQLLVVSFTIFKIVQVIN